MQVHQSSRSDEARRALLEGNFDLAVLCLPPEGGDVLRLASRLRAEAATRDLPVLLAADASQRGLVLRGFDLGANDHVLRPIDANELRARARNQVRRKWYQERLRNDLDRSLELAVTDPLTGLRNRRYVRRHLDGVLRGSDAAVMLLDVDRFKAINDTYGHAAGDAALREVAERLKSHLRAADVLARYGGEEFMVVLAGAPDRLRRDGRRPAARRAQQRPDRGRAGAAADHRQHRPGDRAGWLLASPAPSPPPMRRCIAPRRPGGTGWSRRCRRISSPRRRTRRRQLTGP